MMHPPQGIDTSRTAVGRVENAIRVMLEEAYGAGLSSNLERLERIQTWVTGTGKTTFADLRCWIDAEVEAARKEAGE
jgi:hypothetical protein